MPNACVCCLRACLTAAAAVLLFPCCAHTTTHASLTQTNTGLLEAMAAFSKLLTSLLDKPRVAGITYLCLANVTQLYQNVTLHWPNARLYHPLLAPPAAPILTACWAILQHKPPANLSSRPSASTSTSQLARFNPSGLLQRQADRHRCCAGCRGAPARHAGGPACRQGGGKHSAGSARDAAAADGTAGS